MTNCRVAAEHRFRRPTPLRQGHVPLACDLLQPVPECILEAYARFLASDHGRALEDQRFHEDTPNYAFSLERCFRSGAHLPTIEPIFGSGITILPPARIPTAANIRFFEWFRRDCDSFCPRLQTVWQCDPLAPTDGDWREAKTRSPPSRHICCQPLVTTGCG